MKPSFSSVSSLFPYTSTGAQRGERLLSLLAFHPRLPRHVSISPPPPYTRVYGEAFFWNSALVSTPTGEGKTFGVLRTSMRDRYVGGDRKKTRRHARRSVLFCLANEKTRRPHGLHAPSPSSFNKQEVGDWKKTEDQSLSSLPHPHSTRACRHTREIVVLITIQTDTRTK